MGTIAGALKGVLNHRSAAFSIEWILCIPTELNFKHYSLVTNSKYLYADPQLLMQVLPSDYSKSVLYGIIRNTQ